jgi:hypothetical protein
VKEARLKLNAFASNYLIEAQTETTLDADVGGAGFRWSGRGCWSM